MTRRVGLLVLVSPMLVAVACGGSQNTGTQNAGGASMASPSEGSNVPAPPPIDRARCDDKGKQVITADTNRDNKADVWKLLEPVQQGGQTVQVMTCKQRDLNFD